MSKPIPFAATLEIRDLCLCLHVQTAARALARRFDAALRPLGISSWQFSLLMALNRPVPATIGQVAETLGMDRTTLTANLKPLVQRDLVTVTVDPDDRRGRRVALTEPGMNLLAEALPVWRTVHASIEAQFAPGEPDRLRAGLKTLS
jgi:DNA-binding MarR family transcriptional regulator